MWTGAKVSSRSKVGCVRDISLDEINIGFFPLSSLVGMKANPPQAAVPGGHWRMDRRHKGDQTTWKRSYAWRLLVEITRLKMAKNTELWQCHMVWGSTQARTNVALEERRQKESQE